MRRLTYAITTAILLSLVLACATGRGHDGPNLRRLGGEDTVGGTAVAVAMSMEEPGRRLDALAKVATAYLDADRGDEARILFEFVRDHETEGVEAHALADALTSVGRGYARLGDTENAAAVLERARRAASRISSESSRVAVLARIVEAAFLPSPTLAETLQATIQDVYIVQDFALRADFLLDLLERYRGTEVLGSVNTLIQQTLPAASSIADPWARALAFARIARAQGPAGGELTEASRETLRRSLTAVEAAGEIASGTQALAAHQLVSVLAAMDSREEALRLVDRIPLGHLQSLSYVDLARSYFREDTRAVGFLMLTRAGRSASLAESPARRAEGHMAIARAYHEIDEGSLARFQLGLARTNAVAAESASEKIRLLEETVALYLEQDDDDEQAGIGVMNEIVAELPGGLVLARLRARVSELLLDRGRRDEGAAQFREALVTLRGASETEPGFAVRMSRIAARLDEIDLAIGIAASIPTPRSQIDALADIIRWLPPAYRLSPTTQDSLRQIRS
ncbi:MAG: hypothetical protein ACLFO1_09985 [Spirochaetaceae bacterium]